MNDIEKAYKALKSKLDDYSTLFKYFDGEQPLIYSTSRLKEVFKNMNASFNENWISVVVNAGMDRLILKGWTTEDETANEFLSQIYSKNQIDLESDDVHLAAMITHEAFIVAWKNEEGSEVYYNDPRMCHMFYDPANPKKKQYAAKWWAGSDQHFYMTLYYADRLEYYITKSIIKSGLPKSALDFVAREPATAPNPFKEIPVFHFRTDRRAQTSDITNIITLQDAVNKLLADMMVSAEFGAYRQRYVISNSETTSLKNAPNEIWEIPAGDGQGQNSQVGEFEQTDLKNFLEAIDNLANAIAVISRTPKHYFMSTGSDVSGEALLAMESPLVAKVERHQKRFGSTWIELGAFLAKLEGVEIDPDTLQLIWQPAQSVQPKTEAETIKTNVEAGLPLKTTLRWAGKSKKEIEDIQKELDAEKKAKGTMAQALLQDLKLRNEQSNEQPDGSNPDEEGAE